MPKESQARGPPPLEPGKPCVSLDRLREGLRRTSEILLARLQSLDGEDLEEMLDPSVFPVPVNPSTRGALPALFLFHEGCHCGQLGMVRRLAGKEGRIAQQPVEKVGSAATGPFARSLRRGILDESFDSPAVPLLDLGQNSSVSLPKHFFNGLLGRAGIIAACRRVRRGRLRHERLNP